MNAKYHLDIAKTAFQDYLSQTALDHVIRYNFNVDFYGSVGWKILQYHILPLYPVGNHWYKRLDHFDQTDDFDSVLAMWRQHRTWIDEILDDRIFPAKKLGPIFRVLGRSSHSMTDAYSHTNFSYMLYDYFREYPEAVEAVKQSGKSVEDYIIDVKPTISSVIFRDNLPGFREKYLPKLFSFQSIPDTGPRSHGEKGVDSPKSKTCSDPKYPKLFDVVYAIAEKDIKETIKSFFDKLREDNPAKYEYITGALKEVPLPGGAPGPRERRAFFWAKKFDGWD